MSAGEWSRNGRGAWTGIEWTGWRAPEVRADPYFVWADVTNFAELGGPPDDEWLTVILELKVTAPEFARAMASNRAWIRVPAVYLANDGLEATRYCTAVVKERFFIELQQSLAPLVRRFELGLSILAPSAQDPAHLAHLMSSSAGTGPRLGGTGRGEALEASAAAWSEVLSAGPRSTVFVGIIDDGIPFVNARFLEPGGKSTRVDFFWNQEERETARFMPPPLIPYGRESEKPHIDQVLQQAVRCGLHDEDMVYRHLGYGGVRRRATHGAHVADIACGENPAKAQASPRIIAVHLPTALTSDTSSRSLSAHVLDAMRYIVNRAQYLAGSAARIVINLSYGNIAGPHDGSTILESAMDELVRLLNPRLAIVLAAGNSYQARCHARFELEPRASQVLDWHVLEDDQTPSFLEVWLDDVQPGATVTVTPPGAAAGPAVHPGEVWEYKVRGKVICTVVYVTAPGTGSRDLILVALGPTASSETPPPFAMAGDWRVAVTNSTARTLTFDSWIQRDDTPYGVRIRGRQSRFSDAHYERFDRFGREPQGDAQSGYVRRAGTLSGIATGTEVVVVGAYTRMPVVAAVMDGEPTPYSSSGPGVARPPRRPDVLGVAEDSAQAHGVLGAGTRSGTVVRMNGTSVSAPRVTRWLAERLAQRLPADRAAVQAEAAQQEQQRQPVPPYTAPRGPDRAGAGRMDLPPVRERRFDWK